MHLSKVVLFSNDQKGIETRPAFKGKVSTLEGKEFELVLWTHRSSNNLEYWKGLLNDPEQAQKKQQVTDPYQAVPAPPVVSAYIQNFLPSQDPVENARIKAKLDALPDSDPVKEFYNNFIKPQQDPVMEAEQARNNEKLLRDLL